MNLQEAADDIGLNKSWASRLHARALKFLQSAFRREPTLTLVWSPPRRLTLRSRSMLGTPCSSR